MTGEHTSRHPGGWQFVYWRGNSATTDADADRVELQQFIKGSGYCTVKEFQLPDQWDDVQKYNLALKRAYQAGMEWRSREICALLGVSS